MQRICHPWFEDMADDLRLLQPKHLTPNRLLLSIVFIITLNLDIFLYDDTLSDSQFSDRYECGIMLKNFGYNDETDITEYYTNFDKNSLYDTVIKESQIHANSNKMNKINKQNKSRSINENDEMMSGLNDTFIYDNFESDDRESEQQCKPNEMNINNQQMPRAPSPSMHYATNLMLGALFTFWGVLGKIPIFLAMMHLVLRSVGSKRPPRNFPIKNQIIEQEMKNCNLFLNQYCKNDDFCENNNNSNEENDGNDKNDKNSEISNCDYDAKENIDNKCLSDHNVCARILSNDKNDKNAKNYDVNLLQYHSNFDVLNQNCIDTSEFFNLHF